MFSSCDIVDNYEHEDKSLQYVLENVLMTDDGSTDFKDLKAEYNSQLAQSCTCNEENSCCNVCSHGDNYVFESKAGEMVLKDEIEKRQTIVECGLLCSCNATMCKNRLVQYGPRQHLEVFDSPVYNSKGLRTTKDIPRGAFICEYAGELITRVEAKRRFDKIDKLNSMNYILCLNEYVQTETCTSAGHTSYKCTTTIVDPSRFGNIGRYMNHCCQPNCECYAVRTDSAIPKICIFSKRVIPAFEELCFHYGDEYLYKNEGRQNIHLAKKCLCSSPNCTKYMPNLMVK